MKVGEIMKKSIKEAVKQMENDGKKYNTYELAKSCNLGYLLFALILLISLIATAL